MEITKKEMRTTKELDEFMIDFSKRIYKLKALIDSAEIDLTGKEKIREELFALHHNVNRRIDLEMLAIASKNFHNAASEILFLLEDSERDAFDELINQALKGLGFCEDGSFDPDRITLGSGRK